MSYPLLQALRSRDDRNPAAPRPLDCPHPDDSCAAPRRAAPRRFPWTAYCVALAALAGSLFTESTIWGPILFLLAMILFFGVILRRQESL